MTRSTRIQTSPLPGSTSIAPIKTDPTYAATHLPASIRGSDEWQRAARETGVQPSTYTSAEAHLAALGGEPEPSLAQTDQEITTLVPDVPGQYRNFMEKGESAFRERRLRDAIWNFEMASKLSGRSPESSLGLMLTYFAASNTSYRMPSFYLQQTLLKFPELPLIPFKPRGFYNEPARYVDDLIQLEQYIAKFPADADAHFVMGYLMWTDDDVDAARASLTRALSHTEKRDLIEAIRTLWDGMVSTGKVSGDLEPSPLPDTRPTEASVDE